MKPRRTTTIDVVIEIPKGSRNKYEYDSTKGRFRLDRMLYSAVHYPCDYGHIEDADGEDGDPLDALVLLWEPTFPGCLIEAVPIGVFQMKDEKGIDHKILCVPVGDPYWNKLRRLREVPTHMLREIEHFFSIYKDLEYKRVNIRGWADAPRARQVVREARERSARRTRRTTA